MLILPSVDAVANKHISSLINIEVIVLEWSLSCRILIQGFTAISTVQSAEAFRHTITSPLLVPVIRVVSLLSQAIVVTVVL